METAVTKRAEPCSWRGLDDITADMRRALRRFGPSREDVEDIVQESLLRAARFRHRLTDDERLKPWVMRIAVNVMRDRLRRDSRLPRVDAPDDVFALLEGREEIPGEGPEDDLIETCGGLYERDRLLAHVERAMAELPRPDRRLLDRFYGSPRAERLAARVCEASPGLLKVQVFRARLRLLRVLRHRLALSGSGCEDDTLPRLPAPPTRHRGARRATAFRTNQTERDPDEVARCER